tara:strand:+ start:659 stop:1072 length:414 start_codon:yes stop_codon:yes gene_type:complete
MNKHSKYRPLLDKVQGQIMKAEIGVTGVYKVMLEVLDEAETTELALREELTALRSEDKLLGELIPKLAPFNVAQRLLVMDTVTRTLAQSLAKVRADAVRSVTEQGFEYSVEQGPWGNDWAISLDAINDYANKIEAAQ